MSIIRVTDETPRAEIAEALTHCCRTAIRAPHVMGSEEHPSAWDKAHARLDALLEDWLRAG